MPSDLVLTNDRVIDPSSDLDRVIDVADRVVARIDDGIDAGGCQGAGSSRLG